MQIPGKSKMKAKKDGLNEERYLGPAKPQTRGRHTIVAEGMFDIPLILSREIPYFCYYGSLSKLVNTVLNIPVRITSEYSLYMTNSDVISHAGEKIHL